VRYLVCLCLAGVAWAQGTDPKAKADDYEVHARLKGVDLGAEYMVYSIFSEGKTFLAEDHLVVEVALFPPKGTPLTAAGGEFTLRVDGKTLRPVSPQMVVMAMQRRNWSYPRGPQATVGRGDDVVVLGGPSQQMPPYGVPRGRTPAPPRAPEPENRSGLPSAEPVRLDEVIVKTAFPDGDFRGPVSGYLYFPFTGKASKIKSVELLYHDTRLKLK
jgi:hypothetical protein